MTGLLDADRTAETEAGAIRDFIGRHQADLVAQLCEWVRIPPGSSDERALIDALCRGASTLALLWSGLAGAHLE